MKRLKVRFKDKTVNMTLSAFGVLSAIVSVVDRVNKEPNETERVQLELGGLENQTHLKWGTFNLVPGDLIEIQILDDRISDEPTERIESDPERQKEQERNYVRRRAAEFGWTVKEDG